MSYNPCGLKLPPALEAEIQAALREAAAQPSRRSEILGNTALGLAATSTKPQYAKEAPVLRAIAERIAAAAMAPARRATRDDFQETLEEYEQAHGEFAEDHDVIARADDLHDAKTALRGARVSIAPLSWGQGATLGRTGKFKWDPTAEDIANNVSQSGTLAYWQGEPHESSAVTIDLALPADGQPSPVAVLLPDAVGARVSSRPRGIVSYGADGAITKVAFDAGFGTRLTVTGNYVAVQLAMEPPRANTQRGALSFTASMGAFASPSTAPVFYTEYIDRLPPGQATDGASGFPPIQRPAHAASILAVLSSETTGTASLAFWDAGGATVLFRFDYPMGQILLPIPLPSEVQYISLTNNTGAGASFRVVFQLAV